MKKFMWLGLVLLVATNASAQRGGGFGGGMGRGGFGRGGFAGGGFGRGVFAGRGFGSEGFRARVIVFGSGFPQDFVNFGLPPLAPIPPLGANAFPFFNRGFGYPAQYFPSSGFYGSGFPWYDTGYDYGYMQAPAPSIIIVQQPTPPVVVQEKPSEAQPEIHEYKQTTPAPAPSETELQGFAIVLKDGSSESAMAVWVQDNVVRYVDRAGRHRQAPLDQVDREATRKLNRERKLDLWLPPAGSG